MVDELTALAEIVEKIAEQAHGVFRLILVVLADQTVLDLLKVALDIDFWEGLHVSLLGNKASYHTVAREATPCRF